MTRNQYITMAGGTLAGVILFTLSLLLFTSTAQAHLDWDEADLNNNRVIVWCNNESNGGMDHAMVRDAFGRWNTSLSNAGLTGYVKFVEKSKRSGKCELRTKVYQIPAYAWMNYDLVPNQIVYDTEGYLESSYETRRQVMMHEIGHALGLSHAPTPEYCYPPYSSVTTSWCGYYGAPVPLYPGPHDMEDVRTYWGPGGVWPK